MGFFGLAKRKILRGVGMTKKTVDPMFKGKEEQFKSLEVIVNTLNIDTKNLSIYINSFSKVSNDISSIFYELTRDTNIGASEEEQKVNDLADQFNTLHDSLSEELLYKDTIESAKGSLGDLKIILESQREKIKEYNKVVVDYDHYTSKMISLRNQRDKRLGKGKQETPKEQEKFERNEKKHENATEEYKDRNKLIVEELNEIWNARFENLTPVFAKILASEAIYFSKANEYFGELIDVESQDYYNEGDEKHQNIKIENTKKERPMIPLNGPKKRQAQPPKQQPNSNPFLSPKEQENNPFLQNNQNQQNYVENDGRGNATYTAVVNGNQDQDQYQDENVEQYQDENVEQNQDQNVEQNQYQDENNNNNNNNPFGDFVVEEDEKEAKPDLQLAKKELCPAILQFAQKHQNKTVGGGKSWDLINSALENAGGRLGQDLVFGVEIDLSDATGGDIVVFNSCKFEGQTPQGQTYRSEVGNPNHVAIISKIHPTINGLILALHQSVNGKDIVQTGKFNFGDCVQGDITIYRPIFA